MTYHGDTRHHWQPPPPAAAPPRPPVRPTAPGRPRTACRLSRPVPALSALGCFVVLLPLSVLARDATGARIAGEPAPGALTRLSQLAATFAAIRRHERSARRSVDPPARRVRQLIGTAGGAAR